MLKTIVLIFSIFYVLEDTIIFAKPASITYETKKTEEQKIIIDLSKLNITYNELKELLSLMNGKLLPSIPGGKDKITELVPTIPQNTNSSNPSSQSSSSNPSEGPKPEMNPSSEPGQSNVNGETEKPLEITTESTDNPEDNPESTKTPLPSEVTTELSANPQPENSSRTPPHSEVTNRPPTNYQTESSTVTSATASKGPYPCNLGIDSVENIVTICGSKKKDVQIEGLDK